jgi:hypothetical protein
MVALIDENMVRFKLSSKLGEIPVRQCPMGLRGSLTDEQIEESQTMRQEFQDAVNAKLEEWGVETPEFNGGMGLRGRGARGFGLFKP